LKAWIHFDPKTCTTLQTVLQAFRDIEKGEELLYDYIVTKNGNCSIITLKSVCIVVDGVSYAPDEERGNNKTSNCYFGPL
jgi:hypothetical protein